MAVLLEHIDKIARELKRDVLYVGCDFRVFNIMNSFIKSSERNDLMAWLDEHNIGYRCCAGIATENGSLSYHGGLYIDLPFDETNEKYQLLNVHLCNEDDTPKINGVILYLLPLELAMKNAHHDELGFYEKLADDL